MDPLKIKNHLKITGILAAITYIISSYIFGSLNPLACSSDDRSLVVIIFILFSIIVNLFYYDSYTTGKKFFD
jgi:amino acid transporter